MCNGGDLGRDKKFGCKLPSKILMVLRASKSPHNVRNDTTRYFFRLGLENPLRVIYMCEDDDDNSLVKLTLFYFQY